MKQGGSKLTKWLTGIPTALSWGGSVAIGMLWMLHHQMTPGEPQRNAPRMWPAGVKDIPHDSDRFTLLMLLHPRCPCSKASLTELSQLLARAGGKVEAHVMFIKPPGAPADWCDGDLWNQAKEMPGVSISVDHDAKDAALFGATTSGQVLVYDASGTICFSGGITDGRGHEGDNTGLSALLSLVRQGKAAVSTTPVYGCSLGICRLPDHK